MKKFVYNDVAYRKFVNDMLKDLDIKEFINKEHITNDELEKYMEIFMAYFNKKGMCEGCKGLEFCRQTRVGLKPALDKDGMYIDIDYVPCRYQEEYDEANSKNAFLHLYGTSFSDFGDDLFINNNRRVVLKEVKRFLETYNENPKQKGLYVFGKCGQGKSYIIAYLAIELSKQGIDVAFVYYPDLVRKIKSMVTTGGINELVNELKRVPILILDDFGGESNTNFIRDEVLLPILQYRMVNKKPLFITSNLDEKGILDHLSESTKEIDAQKAVRVFERIKTLVDFVELNDKNYR